MFLRLESILSDQFQASLEPDWVLNIRGGGTPGRILTGMAISKQKLRDCRIRFSHASGSQGPGAIIDLCVCMCNVCMYVCMYACDVCIYVCMRVTSCSVMPCDVM